jgi:hypothetical protein
MKKLLIGFAFIVPATAIAEKNYVGDAGDWDCGKDPVVTITRGQGTFKLTGACTSINIQGGENKLTVESVDSLKIVGGDNQLELGTVGSVKIVGAGNKITWKKAKTGDKPKISAVGANSIEKAK